MRVCIHTSIFIIIKYNNKILAVSVHLFVKNFKFDCLILIFKVIQVDKQY